MSTWRFSQRSLLTSTLTEVDDSVAIFEKLPTFRSVNATEWKRRVAPGSAKFLQNDGLSWTALHFPDPVHIHNGDWHNMPVHGRDGRPWYLSSPPGKQSVNFEHPVLYRLHSTSHFVHSAYYTVAPTLNAAWSNANWSGTDQKTECLDKFVISCVI